MPKRRALTLYQGNAEGLRLAVQEEDDDETPLDLTGVTIEMLVKPTRETADNDTDVITLSTDTGEIIVTNAAAGLATVNAPTTVTATAGVLWYRIDALPGPKTILYGPLTVEDT